MEGQFVKKLTRREVIGGATGVLVAGGAALAAARTPFSSTPAAAGSSSSRRTGAAGTQPPVVFISHGSPMVAIQDDEYTDALASFGALHRPTAVAVVSAHWEAPGPIRITSLDKPGLIYDFGGFPEPLYRVRYPAPGAPLLAAEVEDRLSAAGHRAVLDPARGLDHGVWVPLLRLFPQADIPVVAISLQRPRAPEELWKIGEALASLRQQGVMILGSGGIVHNLRRLNGNKAAAPMDWAQGFDEWVAEKLEKDPSAILGYHADAPNAGAAVPTTEHFDPLFAVLGAVGGRGSIDPIYTGFHHGSLSMRSFAISGA